MINLSGYSAIETAICVKWIIPGFETAYLTDYKTPLTFNADTYTNIGNLLSVSGSTSELTVSPSELSIGLSGIPTGSVAEILNNEIKGSEIYIYRVFLDPTTHAPLDLDPGPGTGNVLLKFKGIVTNYAINDVVDVLTLSASTTITLTCNSIVEVLANKTNGRRTNPQDFPGEASMSRVQALSNSNFNFGAP
jgi:hypothetical protein